MSEAGRQSFTDKAGAALKPDSQKTTTEHIGDTLKGKTDSAASTVEPNSQKSTGQRAGDTLSGNQNENSESLVDKAKNAVGLGNTSNKP
ncbi:heat shock protein 9/12-domain-containing protein [Crepidotus variabilis]|uniref:Heat shock protein 9/12-domain-containing protein n=1 Tax=Crepidotus variabilis TaxID=179855 RepID=A0A9P6EDC3_9AGAR|nr:heat shock protein 9/12-domain-containing protein [Crepidotus variabilis]